MDNLETGCFISGIFQLVRERKRSSSAEHRHQESEQPTGLLYCAEHCVLNTGPGTAYAVPSETVHRTVSEGKRVKTCQRRAGPRSPTDSINRKLQARSFMGKGRIERPFPIGDALAMRPLRKIPAGILLPLAELILGKGISPVATGDQGLCPLDPASL